MLEESELAVITTWAVTLGLELAASPIPIGVESRIIRREPNGALISRAELIKPSTLTLDDVALGVIATVRPDTFPVKLEPATLMTVASVLVVDTTCNTLPFGATPCKNEDCFILATVICYTVISAPNTLILKRSAVVACLFTIIAPN